MIKKIFLALIILLWSYSAAAKPFYRVLLISCDGLSDEAFRRSADFQRIFRNSYYIHGRTITPPSTLPAHASLLSGVPPETHGVTWNDYIRKKPYIRAPTLFDIFRSRGWHTTAIIGKRKLRHLLRPEIVERIREASFVVQAIEYTQEALGSPGKNFVFLHLPQIDTQGHRNGWHTIPYELEVQRIARLIEALLASTLHDPATLVVLTADHGGKEKTHTPNYDESFNIPIVVHGEGLSKQHVYNGSARIIDVPATILYLVDFPKPVLWPGRLLPFLWSRYN